MQVNYRFRIQDSGFRIQDSGFRIQDSGFRIQSERVPEGQGDEEWPEAHHHRFPKVDVFEFLVLERVDEQERRQKGLRGHIETDSAWHNVNKKPGLTISR